MIINVNNLKFVYKGSKTPAFTGVKFYLNKGKVYTIAGSNGTGKTTLLKILAGAYPKLLKGSMSGTYKYCEYLVDNEDLINKTLYVPVPESAAYISDKCINEILLTELGNYPEDCVSKIMKLLPSQNVLQRPLWSLSDGELQRVLLVVSLLSDRDVLLFDEPTLHLDEKSIKILIDLLYLPEWRERIIIATSVDTDKPKMQIIDGFAQNKDVHYQKKNREVFIKHGKTILTLNLRRGKYGQSDRQLLNNINVEIREGSVTHIRGNNGTGKTTLALLIAGINPRFWHAQGFSRKAFGQAIRVAYLDSNPLRQISEFNIFEEIRISSCGSLDKKAMHDLLPEQLLWIKQRLNDDPRELSFGEQKVLLAFAVFSSGAKVVVADEMFAGLDKNYTQILKDLCKKHLKNGGAIVLAGHRSSLTMLAPHSLVDLDRSLQLEPSAAENNKDTVESNELNRAIKAPINPLVLLLGTIIIPIFIILLPLEDNIVLLIALVISYILLPEKAYWRPPVYIFVALPVFVFLISYFFDPANDINGSLALAIKSTNWILVPVIALKLISIASLIQPKGNKFRELFLMFISTINLSSALLRRVDRVLSGTVGKTAKRYYIIKGRMNALWSLMTTMLITILDLAVEHRISLRQRLGTVIDKVRIDYIIPLWIQWSLLLVIMGYITTRLIMT